MAAISIISNNKLKNDTSDISRNINKHERLWVVDIKFCFWQLTVGMAQMESQ
jgi:hypothetical protein